MLSRLNIMKHVIKSYKTKENTKVTEGNGYDFMKIREEGRPCLIRKKESMME